MKGKNDPLIPVRSSGQFDSSFPPPPMGQDELSWLLPVAVFVSRLDGQWASVNKACTELIRDQIDVARRHPELQNKTRWAWLQIFHRADRSRVAAAWAQFLETRERFHIKARLARHESPTVWTRIDAVKRLADDGSLVDVLGSVCVTSDVDEAEELLQLENELLESLARGLPLEEALMRLVRFVEGQSSDLIGSVLLLSDDRKQLFNGAAPSLDPEYCRQVNGLEVGEGRGSCGTAAYRGEPVFVEDIETDPLWEPYRDLARQYGLRACWSTPLKDRSDQVLGTIAIYRAVPGAPTSHHVQVIDMASHLASMVLARHQDDRNLLESEQRFRRMFEQAAVGVAQIDSNTGTLLRANHRYCEILGDSAGDLEGNSWLDVVHPDDGMALELRMAQLLNGEIREFAIEKRLRRKDATYIWANLTVSAMWAAGRKPTTHSVILADITKRKQAEEALRMSEERFRNLVQTAPFGVLRNDLSGRITFANAELGRIYECPPAEMLGRTIWDLALDDVSRERMIAQMKQIGDRSVDVRSHPAPTGFFSRHATANRHIIDVHIDWTPERDRDGSDLGWIVVITDVTARRESERQLEFQADVLNRVSDAVIVTDETGAITYANEAACRVFDVSQRGAELQPTEFHRQLFASDEASGASGPKRTSLARSLDQFGEWQGELEMMLGGEGRSVEVKLKRFRTPDRGVHYLLSVVRDISMRKQAESERRQHRDALAHMTRLSTMGELVAGIAHEVKQPLYAIANFATAASISLRNVEPGVSINTESLADLNEFNDGVRRASQRANEIIQRLREFARKSEQSREILDLNEVVKDSVDLVAFEARQCNANVQLETDLTLPTVKADRIQCEQVVVNLLHNSYEALARIESPRRVIVRTRRVGDQVEIEVDDNGPGIEPEQEARVFEAFCTTKPNGMGMGLAISRTIVEDHGGRLSAASNATGGATFVVALPITKTGQENTA